MKNTIMSKKIIALALFTLSTTAWSFAQSYAVSVDEAKKLAEKLETSINSNNPAVFSTIIYMPELMKRISSKSEISKDPAVMAGFQQGFNLNQMGAQIINSIANGSYSLVRTYQKNNETHVLFRMFGDGGLNYHDFLLYKVKDTVKAADIYIYLTGEELSATLAALLNDIISKSSIDPQAQEKVNFITQLRTLQQKGAYTEIKKLVESQTGEIKENKAIQTIYIQACQHVDTDSYIFAIESFAKIYPNESNIYLLMLDAYYIKKEMEKGINAINKLDSLTGGDPFLNYYKGVFYMLAEKVDDANVAFEKAFQYDPSNGLNMQQLVVTYAGKGNYDKANAVIEQYRKTGKFKQAYVDELYEAIPDLKKR